MAKTTFSRRSVSLLAILTLLFSLCSSLFAAGVAAEEAPVYDFVTAPNSAAGLTLENSADTGLAVTVARPGRDVAISTTEKITVAELYLELVLKNWDGTAGSTMWPEDNADWDNYYVISLTASQSAGANGVAGNVGPGVVIRRAPADENDGYAEAYFVPDMSQWAWWVTQTKTQVALPQISGTVDRRLVMTVRDGNQIYFGDTLVFGSDITAAAFEAVGAQAYLNIGASSETIDTQAAEFCVVNGICSALPPAEEAPVYDFVTAPNSAAGLTLENSADTGLAVTIARPGRDVAISTTEKITVAELYLELVLKNWDGTAGSTMWPEDNANWDNYYVISLTASQSAGMNGVAGNVGPGVVIRRAPADENDGYAAAYFVPDMSQWAWWTALTKTQVALPQISGTVDRRLVMTVRDGNQIYFGDTLVFGSDITAAAFEAVGAQAYLNIGASSEEIDTQAAEFCVVNGICSALLPAQVTLENGAPDLLTLSTTTPYVGEEVTVTVDPAALKNIKAGSLRIMSGETVVDVPTRVGFQTENTAANVFTFTMPAYDCSVVADAAEAGVPNMGSVGWQVRTKDNALRSIHRVFITQDSDGKYWTTVDGTSVEVAEFGVVIGTEYSAVADAGKGLAVEDVTDGNAYRFKFEELNRRYDVSSEYQDLSVAITGLGGHPNTKLVSRAYMRLAGADEYIYTEVVTKSLNEAAGAVA